ALNLRRIERIIGALDKPGGGDELRLIQVEYANAQELADKLLQIFEGGGNNAESRAATTRSRRRAATTAEAAGGEAEDAAGVSITRVIADERTNQLIIIASSRAFEQI